MIAVIPTTKSAYNAPWLGSNHCEPPVRTANQASKNTHPCHREGGPQPHPYRFAGNQYLPSAWPTDQVYL